MHTYGTMLRKSVTHCFVRISNVIIAESVKVRFYKRFLGLGQRTAGYLVRLETGKIVLKGTILRDALLLYMRISRMGGERLPKICLTELEKTESQDPVAYNWVKTIKDMMPESGAYLWQNGEISYAVLSPILQEIDRSLFTEDVTRVIESQRNNYFAGFLMDKEGPEVTPYPRSTLSLNRKRILAACRMNSEILRRLNKICRLAPEKECSFCNLRQPDTLFHMICQCPILRNTAVIEQLEYVDQENSTQQRKFQQWMHVKNLYEAE